MRNLSPHRRFKGPSRAEAKLRPFYQRPWPDDLPTDCPVCGTVFRAGFNIRRGPGKAGRVFRKMAYYGILPCMVLGIILPKIVPSFYEGLKSTYYSWVLLVITVGPPLFFCILSFLMPRSRHLDCKKCGWNRDFSPLPLQTLGSVTNKT